MSNPHPPEPSESEVTLTPDAEAAHRVTALLAADAADAAERGDTGGEALVRATLARVAAARADASMQDTPVEMETALVVGLTPDDGDALDAVLANGGQPGPVPAGLGERAERARGVLALLAQWPVDAPSSASADDEDAVVRRTLEAAAEQRQRERFAQQIEMFAEPRRTLGVSLRQVFAAAAVFLLGISLLMPALDRQRQSAQQAACSYNLGVAGQQMGQYTADHAGMLPRGPVGNSWIKTGQPDAVDAAGRYQSNSAHLYLLIRESYVAPSRLACDSNDTATAAMPGSGQFDWASPKAISYSYQNQHGVRPIRVDRSLPQLAVLADKSPLFVVEGGRMVFDEDARRDAASVLHDGAGQNILTLDGRVRWTVDPHVAEDNVWHIRGHAGAYDGTETPADAQRDSFLVP